MAIAGTAWQVLGSALVFLVGLLISVKLCREFRTPWKRSLALYLWHTLFCFIYMVYVLRAGGDALMYYRTSLVGFIDLDFGTAAVQYITFILTSILGLSLLGTFLVFNVFGYLGLLAFDATLQHGVRQKSVFLRRLSTAIVFLPSISFWSSAIGKDAISFMSAGFALWAALKLRNRMPMMAVAVALMLVVRPHMAALMVMAVIAGMLIDSNARMPQRILLGGLAAAAAAVIMPIALVTSGVGAGAGASDVAEYIELRQSYNMEGGGSVDISSMSLPMQLFTYMFRPLPFEAHSIPALAASLDNMILLFLFGLAISRGLSRKIAIPRGAKVFILTYVLLAWPILAMTSANLGIAVRQKWMFAPMLIFILLSIIGAPRKRRSTAPSGGYVQKYNSR